MIFTSMLFFEFINNIFKIKINHKLALLKSVNDKMSLYIHHNNQ